MTHEHFCIWLAGYLDGNELMDADLKALLREKLEALGQAPVKAQPKADVPRTVDRDDSFRGSPNITDALARGGFVHTPPPSITLGGKVGGSILGVYDPAMTTVCTNTANAAASASAAMNSLSAAARASV
jgi:hypothetical protein